MPATRSPLRSCEAPLHQALQGLVEVAVVEQLVGQLARRCRRRRTRSRPGCHPTSNSGTGPWRPTLPGPIGGPGAGGVLVEALGQVQALEDELGGAGHRGRATPRRPGPSTTLSRAGSWPRTSTNRAAGMSSPVCTTRPLVGVEVRRPRRAGARTGTDALKTVSTACWIRRSTTWPSRPSSMVSISTLPEVEATRASRSLMRGTASVSPRRRARRTALATSVS